MMFTDKEVDLLNSAYQTFVGRSHVLDVLSKEKWSNTGIENWVQTEFTVALIDRDYDVTTIGKRKRDCDLIITEKQSGLDVGLEIKAFTCPYYKGLVDGLVSHSNADLYFFICRYDDEMWKQLKEYLEENSYAENHRKFSGWIAMLIKKE